MKIVEERNKAGAQRLKVLCVRRRGEEGGKKSEQNKTNEPAQMHLGGVGRWRG